MVTRLIHRFAPKQDSDSILSYICRLSRANHYPHSGALASLATLCTNSESWSGAQRRVCAGEVDWTTLSAISEQSVEGLRELTYPPVSKALLWKQHLFLGKPVPWSGLLPHKVRFCPLCISEGTFHSRLWDLTWYTVCDLHASTLLAHCQNPECGTAFDWNELGRSSCLRCGHRHAASPISADSSALALAREIRRLSSASTAEDRDRPWSDLGDLMGLIEVLAPLAIPRSVLGRFDFSPQLWSHGELIRLVDAVWPLVADRPSSITAMRQHLGTSRASFPALPLAAHSLALRTIIGSLPDSAKTWLERSLASAEELGGQEAPAALVAHAAEFVTRATAADILGLSQHSVLALIKGGLLSGQFAHADRKRSDWIIPLASLNELHSHVQSMLVENQPSSPLPAMNLSTFMRSPEGSNVGDTAEVLRAVLDGRIRIQEDPHDTRLAALRIINPSQRLVGRNDALTVNETCQQSGLYSNAVYRLMAVGLIRFHHEKTGPSRQRMVLRSDLCQFLSEYAVVTLLARELKVNPTNLTDRLKDAGLKPVSGPKIDKGLVYVFLRKDIERANLPEILARQDYKSSYGRPLRGQKRPQHADDLVTSSAAARQLGLSVQQVGMLVKRGALQEHGHSRCHGNRRYFHGTAITEYLSRYDQNAQLVPLETALKQLGCSRRLFHRVYQGTGRVQLVRDPIGRSFASVVDLTRVLSERGSRGSLSECARHLDLSRHRIAAMRRRGRIRAERDRAGQPLLYEIKDVDALLG